MGCCTEPVCPRSNIKDFKAPLYRLERLTPCVLLVCEKAACAWSCAECLANNSTLFTAPWGYSLSSKPRMAKCVKKPGSSRAWWGGGRVLFWCNEPCGHAGEAQTAGPAVSRPRLHPVQGMLGEAPESISGRALPKQTRHALAQHQHQ